MKSIATLLFILCCGFCSITNAQHVSKPARFTHADTLRGMNTPERAWWNLIRYDIAVKPDFADSSITGTNRITYYDSGGYTMQLDMQAPMLIDSIVAGSSSIRFSREGNAYHVFLRDSTRKYKIIPGIRNLMVYFHGHPRIAKKAPWDGGWIFGYDKLKRPWMTVACEGLGASVWFPCKDWLGDEPDSGMSLTVTVADSLVAVANGRLTDKQAGTDGTTSYTWEVKNPINNYDIIPYIGKYVHWHSDYAGEKGNLDCDFWVLDYNLEKAKQHFTVVDSMLRCFEYYMGPYPFYEDGYKLVESPHLGMEHQSDIAYGNAFQNGYYGRDLSGTGWGMKWDFIIVHESGHEWFGNNITCKDLADEWIHESFTNYSETLFTGFYFGKEAGEAYNRGIRKNIENKYPIIEFYGVNRSPESTDEYYKGGNMMQLIRETINNDSLFRKTWRGLNSYFYHQTVTARQIEEYISHESGIDFSKVFDEYLRTVKVPELQYKLHGNTISYRWANVVKGFQLKIKVNYKGERWLTVSENWNQLSVPGKDDSDFSVNPNLYITIKKMPG